jgi:NADH-quinone oxidoreductase subunit N
MMMVAHATNFVSLLIGIETMSLAAYVLTGCWRRSLRSSEGAIKYFLMGAFATGFLVYGMAMVYGMSGGELSYAGIAAKVGTASKSPLFFMGEYFILIALAFKVAAVPFHMWAPDTYEGAPTPVTGFMAAGVKAAAFGGIVRLLSEAFGSPLLVFDNTGWASILSVLAAVTMTFGNLAALRQENVKRLLAYSSIAHAGYLLIGVVAAGLGVATARPAVLFYLVTYTFTTLGAFGVVAYVGNRRDERLLVDDWAGLGAARPGAALAMTVFLLSLGGVPPTGGFFGKFYLFKAAMESPQLTWLVVVAVLNSVISVYYYLRIAVAMYFKDAVRPLAPTDSASMQAGLLITAVAVVLLGVFPSAFIDWAGPAVVALK